MGYFGASTLTSINTTTMKMNPQMFEKLEADIVTVATSKHLLPLKERDVKTMWGLLHAVSFDRAYDDEHPQFALVKQTRILPHDGRSFCWFYDGGLTDAHVETALLKIRNNH